MGFFAFCEGPMPPQEQNLLLSSLSEANRNLLISYSSEVSLPLRTSLATSLEKPVYAYFLTSGVASVVASSPEGDTAEVGLIGREGVVGGIHLMGPANAPTETFIQIAGRGLRIKMSDLRAVFLSSTEIRLRILEFVQSQTLALGQIAGCHRFHEAEERLARWLLMAQDRTGSDTLGLTQEFLAMMLGARRTTVTMIAGAMQRSGLIEYHRGTVSIPSRENLEAAACDCYQVVKQLQDGLYRSGFQQ
jgi:CRP-like cAMP-binding protein